jgi:hypothetical protein
MTSDLTPRDDDGFRGSSGSTRLIRGSVIRWDATQHWQDRDGLAPPEQLLVIRVNEVLQKWKDGKPEVIDTKPLPDENGLNAAIPVEEWEEGMDGRPQPPWKHTMVLYAIDARTGSFYTFASSTIGAHMAVDHLRESVEGKRILSRAQVMPVIKLTERPMKTKFGMKTRPHFDIVGWDDISALAKESTPQQLAPPTPEPKSPEAVPTAPDRPPGKMTMLRPAKPPVNLAAEKTVAAKPTSAPDFDDPIPW